MNEHEQNHEGGSDEHQSPVDELGRLLAGLRHNELTAIDEERLEELLLASPEARQRYLDEMSLHGALVMEHRELPATSLESAASLRSGHAAATAAAGEGTPAPAATEPNRPAATKELSPRHQLYTWLALAASLAVIAGLIGSPYLRNRETADAGGTASPVTSIDPVDGLQTYTIELPEGDGILQPQERIDVLLTLQPKDGGEWDEEVDFGGANTTTLETGLEVVGSGETIQRGDVKYRSYSVRVTPDQAAKLNLAKSVGKLHAAPGYWKSDSTELATMPVQPQPGYAA